MIQLMLITSWYQLKIRKYLHTYSKSKMYLQILVLAKYHKKVLISNSIIKIDVNFPLKINLNSRKYNYIRSLRLSK